MGHTAAATGADLAAGGVDMPEFTAWIRSLGR